MSVEPLNASAGEPRAVHPDDEILARHLTDVVAGAGALARTLFAAGVKSWTKDNNSPVTEADLAVDRFLHQRLTALRPDYGWLSEETADTPDRLAARRVWVVDPIDGTRGYMNGAPDWAVSVALVEDGRPLLAALFAPVLDEMFTAILGAGAQRNGLRLAAGTRATLEGARAAGPVDALDAIARVAAITRLPRGHSLALRIARVASDEIDLALSRANSHDWDLAAADLLVQEAGGRLTTFDAAPLTYNRAVPRHGPLLCAGRALHPLALDAAGGTSPSPARSGADPSQP
ncbi:3'(2'),5'-bisphosphate nucleotidase CysQ [Xanthobacter agilis]|uniref:Myo-inositol-1(Or 4)-monophosphatase n=1 Tax=Xanthobacter agilis TaxID=47492 RepID=A0ABU0LDQ5_XANAG|nr:3'(2'),5'-bisphosphate nucleotidase CysQ [Xanthobacter agilis]MDQ0505232.1 myo-inositol-1(or 4)-monophosphatase [Xanthobacter agilis]